MVAAVLEIHIDRNQHEVQIMKDVLAKLSPANLEAARP
jgi:hypothetical protein